MDVASLDVVRSVHEATFCSRHDSATRAALLAGLSQNPSSRTGARPDRGQAVASPGSLTDGSAEGPALAKPDSVGLAPVRPDNGGPPSRL
jgi:hypothetical protein